ncbi:hypothetical protein DY000_02022144 [Brassica cretica]|uniref:RNase H type-1 domain-containing protein n=1 Tax=Brassica cretica TaxID=69181 RepID=A0ABQ7E4U8_BRACR|nr:hypothetical protein DY000_02022144 [Brassica cretica]
MLTDPQAWPNFSTELEVIQILQMCFSDFKISYFPMAQNEIADSLARNNKLQSFEFGWTRLTCPSKLEAYNHRACKVFKRDPWESIFQLHVEKFKCLLKSSVLSQHQGMNTYVCLL